MKSIEREPRAPWRTGTLAWPPVIECVSSAETLVEASPLPSFETAAGHFPKSFPIALPAEVWDAYRAPELWLRVVDRRTGEILDRYVSGKIGV